MTQLGLMYTFASFEYEHPQGAAFLPPQPLLPPTTHWERLTTAGCVRALDYLAATGVSSHLHHLAAPSSADEQLPLLCHSSEYMQSLSIPDSKRRAAHISASMTGKAVERVLEGTVRRAYVVTRPAGHHAERHRAGGGCVFNNAAIAAAVALDAGLERVVILDWDVHHGNGAQDIFWDDQRVLTVSIHQAVPQLDSVNGVTAIGGSSAEGYNINVPLPPGSGRGAYESVLTEIFAPACDAFRPELIVLASGYDAATLDPGGRMMLHSQAYFDLAQLLLTVAEEHAEGRVVVTHEGGYAPEYVPFCVGRLVEALTGSAASELVDPYLAFWGDFAGDQLQDWQSAAIRKARAAAPLLA